MVTTTRLLVALALASFGFGAFLWVTRNAFQAMPLVVVGLFEVVIGLAVAFRTSEQVSSLEQGLRRSVAATVSAETQRMTRINRTFRIVKGLAGLVS